MGIFPISFYLFPWSTKEKGRPVGHHVHFYAHLSPLARSPLEESYFNYLVNPLREYPEYIGVARAQVYDAGLGFTWHGWKSFNISAKIGWVQTIIREQHRGWYDLPSYNGGALYGTVSMELLSRWFIPGGP
jgi:hypothetical protein